MEGSFNFEKVERKTDDLKSISDSLRSMADEREKEIEPEKLKVKNAMEKGIEKQIRIHVRNMVRMRHEVVSYRQISNRLNSMVDYFDKEPEGSKVLSLIPAIVESIDSSLTSGNTRNMLKTMDQIDKQFFDDEIVAKFTSSSATESTPTAMSEDEEISTLIKKIADEYNMKASIELEPSKRTALREEDKEVKKVDEGEVGVKTKSKSCFNIFACWCH
ncbi:charged multivesicular body protein 1b-like [Papaver somniferum]|uniref:charged multivesicular body protein 1b-like n=1 Tax=Papaver somniferum TaxID=3469 RepID=UPI000E6FB5C7|nr:charged multivesicular body protein 1b-like [Papaver somniferum]